MTTGESRPHLAGSPEQADASVAGGRWVHGKWVPADQLDRVESDIEFRSASRGFTIPFRWETAAYATLIALALLLRLWGLGDRAIHHDESLHGFFAFQIYDGGQYLHNPLTHGMFLFHAIAGSFFLFGDSDFTMRLPMAVFGAALVATPLLLKPRMGQVAALLAALMLTFSPALLYFSRFARNDIFIAVFTLLLIGAMFRYIDERKNRWLYVAAAALALGFTAKENMYIVVAVVGGYLFWRTAPEIWDWLMGRHSIKEFSPELGFLVLVGTLTLPLFAAGASVLDPVLGSTLAAPDGTIGLQTGEPAAGASFVAAVSITVVLLLAGAAFGLVWNRKTWLISWVIFASIFTLIFTNWLTHPGGLGTGIWQSLGYWLGQQEVNRGNQPWYYYFMISSAYEFLPFVMTIGTAAFYAFRTGLFSWLMLGIATVLLSITGFMSIQQGRLGDDPVVQIPLALGVLALLAFAMYVRATSFMRFVLFWSIATFAAYSYAGEKMPWLLTHLTLPFIFVTAKSMGDILMSIRWRPSVNRGSWLLLFAVPVFFVALWRLVFVTLESDITSFLALFLTLSTLGMLIVGQQYLGTRIGHRAAWGSAALVVGVLLFGFSFRAAWIASYVHEDVPREILVYTQTSQDIRQVASEIELAGDLTGQGLGIPVSIDTSDSYAWPWHWYLRNYTSARFEDLSGSGTGASHGADIAVVHTRNNDKVEDFYSDGYTDPRRIRHRAWFPEDYRNLTPGVFWDTIIDRNRWRGSIDFFLRRELSGDIGSVDSYVYFSNSLPLSPLN